MNKKIISMAVAAALVAPMAAQADVTVSGRAAVEMTSNATLGMADHGMNRIEFTGTEGDWKAKIAFDMRQLNNATQWGGQRDAWISTKVGGGDLVMGRASTVVANLEGDKFIATFLQLRGAAVDASSFGSGSFNNEVIQYKTKMGGASVGVEYVLSADSAAPYTVNNGHYAVGVKGKAGSVGYYFGMNNGAGAASNMKVGASMEMGGMNVRLGMDQYADSKMNLGVDMKMGGGTLDVTFADKGSDTAATYTRIAYMTKAAGANLHAGYVINGTDGADTFGVGVTVKF